MVAAWPVAAKYAAPETSMSAGPAKLSAPGEPLLPGVFLVPSTETSVTDGVGWPTDLKNASISEATHPPPSSTIAITPPPAAPVGHLYAAHKSGTFHDVSAAAFGSLGSLK